MSSNDPQVARHNEPNSSRVPSNADAREETDLNDGGFVMKLRPQFEMATYTTQELYDRYSQVPSMIDLNPPYQRETVWKSDRQSAFVENVMRKSFVQAIVVNVKSNSQWTCIDGKQRLSAIFAFMNGEISIKSDDDKKSWFYCQPTAIGNKPQKNRLILSTILKQQFQRCSLFVAKHPDIEMKAERSIFQSLQLGMPLSAAEKTRALGTTRSVFCEQLEEEYTDIILLLKKKKEHRAKDFEKVTMLFSAMNAYADVTGKSKPKIRTGDSLNLFMKEEEAEVDMAEQDRIKAVLDKFRQLIKDDPPIADTDDREENDMSVFSSNAQFFHCTRYNSKSFSPIEFVCTGLLIYKYLTRSNDLQLADIKAMRKYLRQDHKDLRANGTVFNTASKFMGAEMKKRMNGDFSGDIADKDDGLVDDSVFQHLGDFASNQDETKLGADLTRPDVSMKDATPTGPTAQDPGSNHPDASMPDATAIHPNDTMSGLTTTPDENEEDEVTVRFNDMSFRSEDMSMGGD